MPSAHGKVTNRAMDSVAVLFKDWVPWHKSQLPKACIVYLWAYGLIFLFFHNCLLRSFVLCVVIVGNKSLEIFNLFILQEY